METLWDAQSTLAVAPSHTVINLPSIPVNDSRGFDLCARRDLRWQSGRVLGIVDEKKGKGSENDREKTRGYGARHATALMSVNT